MRNRRQYPILGMLSVLALLMPYQAEAKKSTGRAAAAKYFQSSTKSNSRQSSVEYDNNFAVSLSAIVDGKAFQWLGDDVGGWSVQLDYRRKSKPLSFLSDAFQLEFQKFESEGNALTKLSFYWSLIFPAKMSFPVYIGVGVGPGVFIQQDLDESWLSIDYKGFAGLRLNSKYSQYFIEGGVKNHLLVLSSGQFIGWFVSSGVAYKF